MIDIVRRLRAEVTENKRYEVTGTLALEAADRIEQLEATLDLYREAVRIDVTMEGPEFMGSNTSALKRAWNADRAALKENSNGAD